METLIETHFTVGSIVAKNFRTADVFKKYKIDFCCKGNRLLSDVCAEKNIDMGALETELALATLYKQQEEEQFSGMSLTQLVDYIEKRHHSYVREHAPLLMEYLNKLVRVHGERHPELAEIRSLFAACEQELYLHMHKEEVILFPSIRRMESASLSGEPLSSFFFGPFANPINNMKQEHETEGQRLEKIRSLTNDFNPPNDACTTYRVAYLKLEEFMNDLHTHIHLENNIVFPKTEKLESQIFS